MADTDFREFSAFLESLQDSEALAPVVAELEALQAIFGDGAIRFHRPSDLTWASRDGARVTLPEGDRIRYEAVLPLPDDPTVSINVLVTLPPSYPDSEHPPQLQLLNRYIGDFGVDSGLFGRVLRTFFSIPPPDGDGVPFVRGEVVVWEGLEHALTISQEWHAANVAAQSASTALRQPTASTSLLPSPTDSPPPPPVATLSTPSAELPAGMQIFESEPIVDRKSVFVGRAVRISDASQIPLVLNHLLADKKIAKASHPIIHAYRLSGPGTSIIQDNDDDGESAAGGRLAHLLQILDLIDVLLVVTRVYGGTHLGTDRFKHIGACARDALEVGGFLDEKASSGKGGAGKTKGRVK